MAAGKLLKKLLKKNKKTIKWLSEQTGIPTTTLYSITKRDTKVIDIEKVEKISMALNIDVGVLCSYFDTSLLHSSSEYEVEPPTSGDEKETEMELDKKELRKKLNENSAYLVKEAADIYKLLLDEYDLGIEQIKVIAYLLDAMCQIDQIDFSI